MIRVIWVIQENDGFRENVVRGRNYSERENAQEPIIDFLQI